MAYLITTYEGIPWRRVFTWYQDTAKTTPVNLSGTTVRWVIEGGNIAYDFDNDDIHVGVEDAVAGEFFLALSGAELTAMRDSGHSVFRYDVIHTDSLANERVLFGGTIQVENVP